jgi:hypothetical protein
MRSPVSSRRLRRRAPCLSDQSPIRLEPLPVRPLVLGDLDRPRERRLGLVRATELVEQDGAADVGGREARLPREEVVVDRERVGEAASVHEHAREAESQRPAAWVPLEPGAKRLRGRLGIAGVIARQSERTKRLLVRGVELGGAGEVGDRRLGLSPTQEARAGHAVHVRVFGREAHRHEIGLERVSVFALELEGVADLDVRLWVVGPKPRDLFECLARAPRALGEELRSGDSRPEVRVVGGGHRGRPELAGRLFVVPLVHGAHPPRFRTTHAASGSEEREGEERLTEPTPAGNIPRMERNTLAQILHTADGITDGGKDGYRVADTHRVSFYLGQAGQAMEISDVERCVLEESFVAIHRREQKGVVFVDYAVVYGLATRALKEGEARKTGFS